MGNKVSNGRAEDVVAPAGTVRYGDLYRISKINGFALDSVASTATDRKLALETDEHAWWEVWVPDALDPAVGALLYWADPTAFQDSRLHLQATAANAGDLPACHVRKTKNAASYLTVRVRNP